MSFPRYPKYKDSGVEWLGEVPDHWDVCRLGTLFREVNEAGEFDLPILSVSIHHGVSDAELDENALDRKVSRSEDRSKYKRVRVGDLVYNMMRAWQGAFGTVSVEGMVSPAYVVARPCSAISTRFVEHVLRTPQAVEEMRRHSRGVTDFRLRLYWGEFKDIRIPLPSLEEVDVISNLVDKGAAKIDALVAEQRRLIELLQEKRRALISHAVTKGLNSDAPVKPSGVVWLGDVPAQWTIAPLGARYGVQLGKMLDSEKITGRHLRPYLRVADVQWGSINTEDLPSMDFDEEAREKFSLRSGDLLVNEGGSYVGRCAIWLGELDECYYQKALHRVRPHDAARDTSRFLYYAMVFATQLGVFVAGGNQNTIDHLPAEKLRSYRFAFPPLEEQVAIVAHLDEALIQLDSLISEAERAIALLQERRTAVISEAVTGKIDVRELAATEAA